MKKHIFVMIRYSVLSENNTAWVIGRDNEFDSYKKELFSEERMSLHEELFFNVTLPSLEKMSPDRVTVLVFTSEELPAPNMEKLIKVEEEYSNIEIVPLSRKGGVIAKMQQHLALKLAAFNDDVCYATVRLDDDDALADDFEEELYKYVDPLFADHAVSFSSGYEGIYEQGSFSIFTKRNSPKIAMGLSLIKIYKKDSPPKNISVYSLGNHTKVDEKHPLIINPQLPMYVRTVHPESDVFAKRFDRKLKNSRAALASSPRDVAIRFRFLREGGTVSIESLPSIGMYGNGFFASCLVTHHKSVLLYSHSSEQIHHCVPDNLVLNSDEELICFDKERQLLILSESGKQLFFDNRDTFSTDDLYGCKPLSFERNGRGLAISVNDDNRYLSAERTGKVTFKKNCKAWEVFYLN